MKKSIHGEKVHKLVNEFTGGDPAPTWEDKLKNQMGYGRTSSLAPKIHGWSSGGDKHGARDQEQLLSDLGVKTTTENTGPEEAEDKMVRGGKKVV
jgi:hypothetical protein